MGFNKERRPTYFSRGLQVGGKVSQFQSSAANVDMTFAAATNGVKVGRLVRIKSAGVVVPTTGSSGRAGIGFALSSASSGSNVLVRVGGLANAVASTAALAAGAYVRGNAGASTSSSAGTVRAATNTTGGFGVRASVIGIALTSAAAGAISSTRTVKVFINHVGQVLI